MRQPLLAGRAGPAQIRPRRARKTSDWMVKVVELGFWAGIAATMAGFGQLISLNTTDQVGAVVMMVAMTIATAVVIRMFAAPADRQFLGRMVVAGVLIRLGLTLTFHAQFPVGFFAPDQYTFQDVGWRTLLYLRGQGQPPRQIGESIEVGYFYWNAFIFALLGYAPLAPKVFNAFLGGWLGLVAYRIGGELVGRGGARSSAVIVTFFPSLILWSTQNLRDVTVILVLEMILWVAIRARVKIRPTELVGLVALVGLMVFLRDYMAYMIVFAFGGSIFISAKRSLVANMGVAVFLFGIAFVAYNNLGLGDDALGGASFEMLNTQRQALATGGTAFRADTDISSPLRGVLYLPLGTAFFLFSPFPWQLGSTLTIITLPEQVIWYSLFPMVVYGWWWLMKERLNRVLPVVVFVFLTGSIYALVEGNAGTAYRHRAQLVVFMLCFAAVGLEVRKASAIKRRAIPKVSGD